MENGAIRLYIENPMAGGTNGKEISESTQEFPLNVVVNTGEANHTIVKAALRCDTGYRTTGPTEITFSGATAARWQIADDDNFANEEMAELATFSDHLEIEDTIGDTNHIVWLKISATASEEAQVDTSVKIHLYGNAVPA